MAGIYAPIKAEGDDGIIKMMMIATDDYEKTVNKAYWKAEHKWKFDCWGNEYPYVVSVVIGNGESCALTRRILRHAPIVARIRIFDSERKRVEFLEMETENENHLTRKNYGKGKD